ncbi:MAG TPA: DUF488 domain-containing protein [Myxococcaceae bacterium]|nr:DUF488 domain-containing protein [Myxococcaceae bacterium]
MPARVRMHTVGGRRCARMLVTVGHGTLDEEALGSLLTGTGIERVVDVRRFPGSRAHPHVAQDALARWLPALGVEYRWEPRLGGRRAMRKDGVTQSPDTWWTVTAFRAYAGWTRSPTFQEAMQELLDEARTRRLTVMCSESVWWRCHRRLIADVAVLGHGIPVQHLMHDGRLRPHPPAEGARRLRPGCLIWDAGAGADDQLPVM